MIFRTALKYCAICLAMSLLVSSGSRAVLIASGDGQGNTSAPVPDPGWANIGAGNGLTVVYIGNGWVLSAGHVGEVTVAIDGGVYPPVAGSRVLLRNSNDTESDLELFRIDPQPPSLPALTIRATPVSVGELTLMVGNGRDRGTASTWQNPPTEDGYHWGAGKRIRWGTNVVDVSSHPIIVFGLSTHAFITSFTKLGTEFEGQATKGDSGGPVFTLIDSTWELSGIMFAMREWAGQPAETSIYGNQTLVADLSHYRQQILEITNPDCGNGQLTVGEECDDGNTLDGDCCSSTCRFEIATSVTCVSSVPSANPIGQISLIFAVASVGAICLVSQKRPLR